MAQAFLWIMAHEAGHVFNNANQSMTQRVSAVQKEVDADRFATTIFRRIHAIPGGAAVFFSLYTNLLPHSGDYPDEASWAKDQSESSHPLNGDRMIQMANELAENPADFVLDARSVRNVLALAETLKNLGHRLNDPGLHRLANFRSLVAHPNYLGPVPKTELALPPFDFAKYDNFNGEYSAIYTHKIARTSRFEMLPARMLLARAENNEVSGFFNFGLGIGTLKGTLKDENTLPFTWTLGVLSGKGVFTRGTGTTYDFVGTWGNGAEPTGGGRWMITRDNKTFNK